MSSKQSKKLVELTFGLSLKFVAVVAALNLSHYSYV